MNKKHDLSTKVCFSGAMIFLFRIWNISIISRYKFELNIYFQSNNKQVIDKVKLHQKADLWR